MRTQVFGVLLFGFANLAALSSAQEISLEFPEDRVVGLVQIRTAVDAKGDRSIYDGWTTLSEATGSVSIPANHDVCLRVDRAGGRDLSFLETLPPDSLFGLMFFGSKTEDEQVNHVAKLSGLRWLYIRDTRITGAGLAPIGQLENLEILNYDAHYSDGQGNVKSMAPSRLGDKLTMHGFDDDSIKVLASCQKLHSVSLSMCPITYRSLLTLGQLKNLETLAIQDIEVTDKGLELFTNLKQLRWLSIGNYWSGSQVNDRAAAKLARIEGLTSLSLRGSQITAKSLESFASMPNLEYLSVEEVDFAPDDFKKLSGSSSLKRLFADWKHQQWRDYGETLASIKTLEQVGQNLFVDRKSLGHLLTLPNLKQLSVMSDETVDDFAGIGAQLAACKQLEELWLQEISISDDDLLAIHDLKEMRRVSLFRTQVRGPGFQVLSEFPKLEGFNVSGLDDLEVDLTQVPQLSNTLEFVGFDDVELPADPAWYLRFASISSAQIGALILDKHVHGMTSWQDLETLQISESALSEKAVEQFLKFPKLEYLSFAGAFTIDGLSVLNEHPTLRRINVSSPYIQSDDMAELERLLPQFTVRIGGAERCIFPGLSDGILRESSTQRVAQDKLEGSTVPGLEVIEWLGTKQFDGWGSLQGKVVLLTFWTPQARRLDEHFQQLKSIHDEFGNETFEIVEIHRQTDDAGLSKGYVADFKPPWFVGVDDSGKTAGAFLNEGLQHHLVDGDGVLRVVGFAELGMTEAILGLIDE